MIANAEAEEEEEEEESEEDSENEGDLVDESEIRKHLNTNLSKLSRDDAMKLIEKLQHDISNAEKQLEIFQKPTDLS